MIKLCKNNRIKLLFASEMEYGNFGDLLSRYLIEKLTGAIVEKYDHRKEYTIHLDAIGSILGRPEICSPAIIWGSGFLSPQPLWKIKLSQLGWFLRGKNSRPTVYAVRGKLTRDILVKSGIVCPEIYGDPALLMPMIYNKSVPKKYRLGVILHHNHQHFKDQFLHPDVKWIDVYRRYREIESFINEVLECEAVLSSSLHGLIIPNAYRIPCVRLKIEGHSIHPKADREDFKFKDYLSGLNSYCKEDAYDFSSLLFDANSHIDNNILNRIAESATSPSFSIDYTKLLSALPKELFCSS